MGGEAARQIRVDQVMRQVTVDNQDAYKALSEVDGDVTKAVQLVREQHLQQPFIGWLPYWHTGGFYSCSFAWVRGRPAPKSHQRLALETQWRLERLATLGNWDDAARPPEARIRLGEFDSLLAEGSPHQPRFESSAPDFIALART